MRRIVLFVSIFAVALALLPAATAAAGGADERGASGSYIVVLKDGEPGSVAAEHSRRHNASVRHVYRHALNGYAAQMSDRAAENIARDPRVDYVEADGVVTATDTQTGATWGLDRIDQRSRDLNSSYTYASTGAGVTAYVIDTGILATHAEFVGRVGSGAYAINDGRGTTDCDGHGTHVAGTIGGTTYGVAKGVTLVPVRVLDCNGSGTWSGVIAGLDWVAGHHPSGAPAVANMSLGGGASSSVDAAVDRVIADGVTVAVAAGNGNRGGKEQDACGYSPARVPAAITIGATSQSDAKTSWSNYGSCVDWFAPGYQITSAWYTSTTATNTISGTSMAAPHVAGAAALYLESHTNASPTTARDALYTATTKDVVSSSNTANNHLLFTGSDSGGGEVTPPPNQAPTAAFSATCDNLVCQFTDASDDDDGSIASRSWDFGDDTAISTDTNPLHTYDAADTYSVTLTVTDDKGATDTDTQIIEVTAPDDGGDGEDPPPPSDDITLTATAYKVKGLQKADLSWSPSGSSTAVDVYRNGTNIVTTGNDGAHTDNIDARGGGSYTYRVCEAGTTTCSADVTVTF